MMTKEGSTQIVNFMTPGTGVRVLGLCHISNYSENVLSSTISIYSTLFTIVLMEYDNDNQGRVYPNCKFHDPWGSPGAGILMLERGHIRHYNEFVLSSLYQNIAH